MTDAQIIGYANIFLAIAVPTLAIIAAVVIKKGA